MILAVDVGNTNIVFGGFDNNGELRFISRLNTQVSRMEAQYAIKLKDILSLYGFENAAITRLYHFLCRITDNPHTRKRNRKAL